MKVVPLADFVPALSPNFSRPDHLQPIVDTFERIACGDVVRACVSAPPRHWKTTTLEHGAAWLIAKNPGLRIIWASYGQRFSERASRRVRNLVERIGVSLAADSRSRATWSTGVGEGNFWCTSVGGSITGEGANLLIVDDPTKGRADAESALDRARIYEWFNDDALTRLEPGASVIVDGARWHVDDLIGRLVNGDGWEYLRLPAISDDGRALCPQRYSVEQLRAIEAQLGRYGFQSLYQGNPEPRGGQLFVDAVFYELPLPTQMRIGIGIDMAYSTKTKSDFSVAVVLGEAGGIFYVLDVIRLKVRAPDFKRVLDGLAVRYPGVRPFSWVGGQEKGVVDLMNVQGGTQIDVMPAVVDKFTRAQPVSAAWNNGNVRVPHSAPWLNDFVSEVCGFTGIGDVHDDQVDALAAAFEKVRVAHIAEAQRRALNERVYRIHAGFAAFGECAPPDALAGLSHEQLEAINHGASRTDVTESIWAKVARIREEREKSGAAQRDRDAWQKLLDGGTPDRW